MVSVLTQKVLLIDVDGCAHESDTGRLEAAWVGTPRPAGKLVHGRHCHAQ